MTLRSPVRTVTIVSLLALVTPTLFAGTIEKKFGTDDNALAKKVDLPKFAGANGSPSGKGQKPYLPALGAPPKRVALVSFYNWDVGNVQKRTYRTGGFDQTTTWSTSSQSVTTDGGEGIVAAFYASGFAALKDGLAAHGMTLLTSEEYLDTPEKKAAYEAFKIETGGSVKFVKFLAGENKEDELLHRFEAPGYRLLSLASNRDIKGKHFELSGDGKLYTGLGHDLAESLGVDAVMIVYNVIQADKNSIDLLGTYAYMFGPNPVKAPDTALYWPGHQYAGAFLRMDVPVMKTDRKGKELENSLPEYAHVAKAVALRMGEFLDKETHEK
jgi:hypothetical protein